MLLPLVPELGKYMSLPNGLPLTLSWYPICPSELNPQPKTLSLDPCVEKTVNP